MSLLVFLIDGMTMEEYFEFYKVGCMSRTFIKDVKLENICDFLEKKGYVYSLMLKWVAIIKAESPKDEK